MGSYDGTFNGVRTMGGIAVSVKRQRIFKLVNSGNTKGDALLHVVTKVVHRSEKRILVSRRPIFRGREVGRRFFCVPSSTCVPTGCGTLSVTRFCHYVCPKFRRTHFRAVVGRFRLSKGQGVDAFSGKVGGRLLIVLKVDAKAGCLFYSRAFSNLSPMVHRTMGDVFTSRVVDHRFAPIVTSRGLHRLRSVYSRVKLLRRKKVLLSESLRSVGFRVRGVRYMLASGGGRRRLGGRLSILGARRRNSLLLVATEKAEERVVRGVRTGGPLFYRILPLALRRVFVDRARITNCRIGGLFR